MTQEFGDLDVLSVEDLVARTTALVCGRIRPGRDNRRQARRRFSRLRGLGQPQVLAAAWNDHRQQVPGTLEDASLEAVQLLEAHPELIVVEEYSGTPVACGRCRTHGAVQSVVRYSVRPPSPTSCGNRPAHPRNLTFIFDYLQGRVISLSNSPCSRARRPASVRMAPPSVRRSTRPPLRISPR